MKQTQIGNIAVFLPNYFKKIGIGVFILTILIGFVLKIMHFEFSQIYRDIFKLVSFDLLILGLFFIAWSRDKVEDEMTLNNRLQSVGLTFIMTIFYVITKPIIYLFLFQELISEGTSVGIIIIMLMFYIGFYQLQKKNLK